MTHTPRERVLITGGGGFIGSHLAEHLLALGAAVTVIDNFSTGRRSNLARIEAHAEWQTRFRLIEGDLSAQLPALDPHNFDVIYHLAAAVGVRLVVERPIHTIETNVEQASALLRFAARGGCRTLMASTSEVYGKGLRTPMCEDDDVIYGPTTLTRWSYAASKAIDEYLALAYHREHALPAYIVRFFNTVGPRQVGEYGMVLPRFVQAALLGMDLEVHGDGMQSRCFCDARDVVLALPKLLARPECAGRVFNIGNDTQISILELAQRVIAVLGSRSGVRLVPYAQAFAHGFDDLLVRQPDLTRVRAAIGFAPTISLDQTIRDLAAELRPSLHAPADTRGASCS
ncbi:MAG: NAD-dependent epimerase/dehydratase family protein [Phycisphaerales bacterium]|nr:NAD-dependent epimerase/dehydratase family protein [Phycisphaerales bacterium]